MTRFTSALAALLLMAPMLPLRAQSDSTPSQATACCNDDHHAVSDEERRRHAAEARMLDAQARRERAEAQMLHAQRAVMREEQRRIKAHSQAMLSEAKQREWEHRMADVRVDLLTGDAQRYHTVILTSVTGQTPKESVRHIAEALGGSATLKFINPLKIKRKYRTHRKLALGTETRPGVLRMQLHREPFNEFGRFVRLTLIDHTGTVVYEAHYENMHYGEMLAPLQGVSLL